MFRLQFSKIIIIFEINSLEYVELQSFIQSDNFNPCGAEGIFLLQSSQNHFSVKIPENISNKEIRISLKLLNSRRCPGAHWKAQ